MSNEAYKLLLMFINDSYQGSGKPKKKTILTMMKYVESEPNLQALINIGDTSGVLEYQEGSKGKCTCGKNATKVCDKTPAGGWGTMKCGKPLCHFCTCACDSVEVF